MQVSGRCSTTNHKVICVFQFWRNLDHANVSCILLPQKWNQHIDVKLGASMIWNAQRFTCVTWPRRRHYMHGDAAANNETAPLWGCSRAQTSWKLNLWFRTAPLNFHGKSAPVTQSHHTSFTVTVCNKTIHPPQMTLCSLILEEMSDTPQTYTELQLWAGGALR